MQKESKNKMMTGTEEKVKQKRQYHFAGDGIYKPCVVEAGSREEATKEWEKKRVKSQ